MTTVRRRLLTAVLGCAVAIPGTTTAALRTVVAEEFTGTWCGWCPSAMEGLHNLGQQVGDRLTVVAYHVSDSFQLPGCVDRKNYYGVTAYPTVIFDGLIRVVGGDTIPVDYWPFYIQREGIPSPVTLDLALLGYDGATGQGSVRATIYNEAASSSISASLRYVAVGNDTSYTWQGFDHLYYTALHIFPSAGGVPIVIEPGQVVTDVQDFTLPSGWYDRNCSVVAFLQDDATKEILQGSHLGQVTPVELVSFTAQVSQDGVVLSWITASEKDNAGFRIYRITDGREEVITRGMIPGAGNSSVPHSYEHIDRTVEPGTTYRYRLSDVSLSGLERFHSPVTVSVPPTWGTPTVLHLEPARPCPASDRVSLSYSLPVGGRASLAVYDLSGREVRSLVSGQVETGHHTASWGLVDNADTRVSPGLYVVRLATQLGDATTRVVVTR